MRTTTKKGEMKMHPYRNGDVDFLPRKKSDIPAGCKAEKLERYIVAYGEATGHNHQLNTRVRAVPGMLATDALPELDLSELPTLTLYTAPDGRRFIEVEGNALALTHHEHHALSILPGIYEIEQERTFDYFENSIKKVID